MESTVEEEELFSHGTTADNTPLEKRGAEDREMRRSGDCVTTEEPEFHENQTSRKRKWNSGEEAHICIIKQNINEEVEPFGAFNAHVLLSNEDLMEGDVQDDGVGDLHEVTGENGDEEEEDEIPMDNAFAKEEVEPFGAFNAHVLFSNEDLMEGDVEEDGVGDFHEVTGEYGDEKKENILMDNALPKDAGEECPIDDFSMEKPSARWQCDVCKCSFLTAGALRGHRRIHTEERNSCDVCEFTSPFPSFLKLHKQMMHTKVSVMGVGHQRMHPQIHAQERPYKCEDCGFETSDFSILNRHKETHSVEKTIPCTHCDKRFYLLSLLVQHKIRAHPFELSYECEICDYKTSYHSNLKQHKRNHADGMPYSCFVCGEPFSCESYLAVHMRVHTRERPYECDICGYMALELSHLKNHLRSHTDEKRYSCTKCGYKAAKHGWLANHKKKYSH